MDGRQRDEIRLNIGEQPEQYRYLLVPTNNHAFSHGSQHSYRRPNSLRDALFQGEQFLDAQRLHIYFL
jgi:hypothetical protein